MHLGFDQVLVALARGGPEPVAEHELATPFFEWVAVDAEGPVALCEAEVVALDPQGGERWRAPVPDIVTGWRIDGATLALTLLEGGSARVDLATGHPG